MLVEKSVKQNGEKQEKGSVLTSLPGEVSPRGLSSVGGKHNVKLEQKGGVGMKPQDPD